MKIEKIDWNKFNDQYVRLETGVEKKLKLTNWQAGEFFGNQPGIRFDVLQEDCKLVQKQFTATSRRLIRHLKPILLKAETDTQDNITVGILRTGEGWNTRYMVRELPQNLKEILNEEENNGRRFSQRPKQENLQSKGRK